MTAGICNEHPHHDDLSAQGPQGQGVSSGVVFFNLFFFWWGKDRLHLLHVPGLHILQVEKRGGKVENWYKMLRNLFLGGV